MLFFVKNFSTHKTLTFDTEKDNISTIGDLKREICKKTKIFVTQQIIYVGSRSVLDDKAMIDNCVEKEGMLFLKKSLLPNFEILNVKPLGLEVKRLQKIRLLSIEDLITMAKNGAERSTKLDLFLNFRFDRWQKKLLCSRYQHHGMRKVFQNKRKSRRLKPEEFSDFDSLAIIIEVSSNSLTGNSLKRGDALNFPGDLISRIYDKDKAENFVSILLFIFMLIAKYPTQIVFSQNVNIFKKHKEKNWLQGYKPLKIMAIGKLLDFMNDCIMLVSPFSRIFDENTNKVVYPQQQQLCKTIKRSGRRFY